MSSSPSTIVFDFAEELIAAADANSELYDDDDIEALDSKFQAITTNRGIVISNSEFDLAPTSADVGFYDSLIIVGFFVRIPGTDTTERKATRDRCFEMAREFADAIFTDQTLGGRVCDCLVRRAVNGDTSETSDSYSVINLPIILNPTGDAVDINLGDAR